MRRRTWLWGVGGTAVAVLLSGCGTPSAVRPPPPAEPVAQPWPEPVAPERAQAVTLHALGLVGTPYRYGGNTPESGFDCSGLIGYVFWHAAQVVAPRTVQQLSGWGQPVPRQVLRTGDLVVFSTKGRASHAGIYVGEGRFVHAPSTGGTVRLDRLSSQYWARQPVEFRRL